MEPWGGLETEAGRGLPSLEPNVTRFDPNPLPGSIGTKSITRDRGLSQKGYGNGDSEDARR
eukprot:12449947-Heterocapsa_arctica.AAC.1